MDGTATKSVAAAAMAEKTKRFHEALYVKRPGPKYGTGRNVRFISSFFKLIMTSLSAYT